MIRPCVAVLVPSLDRPHRLSEVVGSIRDTTPPGHRLLFCVSDDESKRILRSLDVWFLDDSDCEDRRYVTRMNKLVRHAGDAETVFFGQDDVVFHEDWYAEARAVMEQTGKGLVVVNDLHNPNGTAALMRADYIPEAVLDEPGNVFYSGYLHNFADDEQFLTAKVKGQFARAPRSHVEHLHPSFGGAPMDETYARSWAGWDHDSALFRERAARIAAL